MNLYILYQQQSTIDAYNEFLQKYSDAPQRDRALAALFVLYKRKNTVSGYDEFINRYPNSKEMKLALAAEFILYKQLNVITGYKTFIEKFPNAPQVADAYVSAFAIYKKKNTIIGYKDFIKSFPNAPQTSNAYATVFLFYKKKNTITGYKDFIKIFHNAPQTSNAYAAIFSFYKKKNTIASYRKFIKNFPNAPQINDAYVAVFAMYKKRDTEAGYKEFINKFPNAPQLNEATIAIYMLKDTIQGYRYLLEHKSNILNNSVKDDIESKLAILADIEESSDTFYFLYKTTDSNYRKKSYLRKAMRYVKDSHDEQKIVKLNPDAFFKLGSQGRSFKGDNDSALENIFKGAAEEGIGGALLNLYFPRTASRMRPKFKVAMKSFTKFGTYRVRVKFILTIREKIIQKVLFFKRTRYNDIAWDQEKTFIVSPGEVENGTVNFKQLATHEKMGIGISAEITRRLHAFKGQILSSELIR